MVVYRKVPGARLWGDPQAIGEHLESMRLRMEGELHPSSIVEDARSTGSPLHDEFEWDDSVAAQLQREQRARHILRSLQVEIVVEERSASAVAFVPVWSANGKDEGRVYTSVTVAMGRQDLQAQVMDRALSELRAFRQKYADLKEFAALFVEADMVLASKP